MIRVKFIKANLNYLNQTTSAYGTSCFTSIVLVFQEVLRKVYMPWLPLVSIGVVYSAPHILVVRYLLYGTFKGSSCECLDNSSLQQ
jgi:hypothetical protein